MSALLQSTKDMQLCETIAHCQARPGELMIVGQAQSRIAKAGSARVISEITALGVFRAETWELENSRGFGFLILVRLPKGGSKSYVGDIALRGSRAADLNFGIKVRSQVSPEDLADRLVDLASGSHSLVSQFLLDVSQSDLQSEKSDVVAFGRIFMLKAAQSDGCIELILSVADKAIILQGWGSRSSGAVRLATDTGREITHWIGVGEFERTDVNSTFVGIAYYLGIPPNDIAFTSQYLFVITPKHLFVRRIIDSHQLHREEAVGQLRHLLPRLKCSHELEAKFRDIIRPRYERVDTVNHCNHPVRLAVDIAVCAEKQGAVLSGWLLDPDSLVVSVVLVSASGRIKLDLSSIRTSRSDVTEAYSTHPLFPSSLETNCGFFVYLSDYIAESPHSFVQVELTTEEILFLPIIFLPVDDCPALEHLLNSVDLSQPTYIRIVDEALGPFLFSGFRNTQVPSSNKLDLCSYNRAVVVPIYDNVLPRAFVTSLMSQVPIMGEHFVFVCAEQFDIGYKSRLQKYIALYCSEFQILYVNFRHRPIQALMQTLLTLGAKKVLLVDPNISDFDPNKREILYEKLDRYDIVCPTIMYEDGSIRYAGRTDISALETAPFVRVTHYLSGFPPSNALLTNESEMRGGSINCCGFTRQALTGLDRLWPQLSRIVGEPIIFLEAQRLGISLYWDTSISVVSPDNEENAAPIRGLIDSWMLRRLVEVIN